MYVTFILALHPFHCASPLETLKLLQSKKNIKKKFGLHTP